MKPLNPQIKTLQDYHRVYQQSLQDPDAFWSSVAKYKMRWKKEWDQVSDWSFKSGRIQWFLGAEINVTENCLDRHIHDGKGNHPALIWVGNELDEKRTFTFTQLYEYVCQVCHAFEKLGTKKGDRVVLYMPNIPELAVVTLACARLGLIHSIIFGGFSAHSIQNRVNDCGAKWLVTANGTLRGNKWIDLKENVDEAVRLGCPSLEKVIIYDRDSSQKYQSGPLDLPWKDWVINSLPKTYPAIPHQATDPLFILYTSGSTGKPKGVLHSMGGYLTYVAYTFEIVFQPEPNDIYWCTADMGWITGHSYLLYGPLSNGTTTVMFEGIPTYPDPGRFWRVVDELKVSIFYSAPTAIRILASAGDEFVNKYSRKSLRTLGSVGEPINPEAWKWYFEKVGDGRAPIVDTWWQTETGGILISPLAGITPTKPGSATLPLPGIEPEILDEEGVSQKGEASGSLVLVRSWPGQMIGVYGDEERFRETYLKKFPNAYFTGDGAHRDEKGYYTIIGRTDDVIKVSGHRLGTAEIESACLVHPSVAESGVVGMPDEMTGEALAAFVVLRDGVSHQSDHLEKLRGELSAVVRREVGPVAHLKKIYWVPGLPKTRSGKIMRRILKKISRNELTDFGDISTLADPGIVERITEAVSRSKV